MKNDIRFLLTNNCNYNCYFCHNEGACTEFSENELSVEQYVKLYKVYSKMEKWEGVTLSGGEPLIFSYIDELSQKLWEQGAKITLVTNGSMLSNHFQALKYINRINVSIHTLNEDNYNNITGRKNLLNQVKENLLIVRKMYPNLEIRLNVTPCKSNYWNIIELKRLIEFSKKIKSSLKITELFPINDKNSVSVKEITEELEKLEYVFVLKKGRVCLFENSNHYIYITQCTCAIAVKSTLPIKYCQENHDLYVNHNGKFLLCRLGKETIDFWNEIKNGDIDNLQKKIKIAKLRVSKNSCYKYLKILTKC